MWSFLVSMLVGLWRLLKKPSDAQQLGRTQTELDAAKKTLQEVIDAKKIDTDIANTPIDALKLHYKRFKTD